MGPWALDQTPVRQALQLFVFGVDEADLVDLRGALRFEAPYLFAQLFDAEFQLFLLWSSVSAVALKKSRFPGPLRM
jgi:hypothetical protein